LTYGSSPLAARSVSSGMPFLQSGSLK